MEIIRKLISEKLTPYCKYEDITIHISDEYKLYIIDNESTLMWALEYDDQLTCPTLIKNLLFSCNKYKIELGLNLL